jgi:hypothetical protein
VAALVASATFLSAMATTSQAQTPYPTTTAPSPQWGGVAMPQAVPYQPTLVDPDAYSPYPNTVQAIPADAWVPAGDVAYPDEWPVGEKKPWFPPGGRQGVFQKVNFTGAYLPRLDDDGLGLSEAELDVVFGLPFITRETPLLVTPFYGVRFVDGPVAPDVPPRLHDAAIKFEHIRPLGDEWLVLLDVTLGEFADDDSFGTSDAFRITGGGAAVYRTSDAWKWVLGAQYIDRANADVLPVAGVVYTPNDEVEYKLVFPTPKVSWRLPWSDAPGLDERWAYVGAEYGGGAWAVERTSGATDELDITEYRVFLGYERKITGGLSRRVEIGYVFGRELEYDSTPGDVTLDDTLMLRGGLTY